jgi:hypothetical protein
LFYLLSTSQVLTPNIAHIGQKLRATVISKVNEEISNKYPSQPVTIPNIYNPVIIIDAKIRTPLSALPMFGFIIKYFVY